MLAIEHKCRSNIRMGILTVQLAIEVLLMRGLGNLIAANTLD